MKLSFWTYEGPAHFGAIRIAASMRGVHLLLHSPQGDTYADLLFTMIEREGRRPPVTYTTFQARDLGSSTAELVLATARDACERFKPDVLLVTDSCTAELIQDQPGTLVGGANMSTPVISVEMAAYSRKENWGASETFFQLVRGLLASKVPAPGEEPAPRPEGQRPSVNLLGPTLLGFRCRDDVKEITALLDSVGVDVNVVAPLGASAHDLQRLPLADANVCLSPEVADSACEWLTRNFRQPLIRTVPIGVKATDDFLQELATVLNLPIDIEQASPSRLPWYSRSVDSTYLTDKRVFIFADASHAVAAARIASSELGFEVVGLGTYSREQARSVREAARELGLEPLITDDYLEVERHVAELRPEMILGTQMERHIAKRLGIGCAVISTPAHVQDYPARYSPQMGYEGANVIFDTWVHPLMMGLEEHLLRMFREDFEFNDSAAPSHLEEGEATLRDMPTTDVGVGKLTWDISAEKELKKIPFFVRGKARRNTEEYAQGAGLQVIDVETLYEAKAHFSR
ncbi:light-independent protochlorophyllide reductase, B subunit [Luminiphilus syltensis NOR5-1B]|uniref:Light-independent protochlorophyllide reductase subunit B n=1 Tax=Luminiphilus syltensis NOR5-1B TaxID=565045 RepID=B8KT39_9GAMM|nr:ferredoxin:protochlorophyllide reductase (ATP-dependent) subunit B [Luminiphilus syltensis]EED36454.1 light-independent protochlorophyllide reductase, B subunit [Luminiphilus syltensis NOR5-1B]